MRLVLVAVLVVIACRESSTPPPAPTKSPATVSATPPPPVVPAIKSDPIGWWRSDDVCLELFANGDAEVSIMTGPGPKRQVIGAASLVRQKDNVLVYAIKVERVWRARYTGPCRRTHEFGGWDTTADALGATFTAGATTELELRRIDDDHAQLCAKTCVAVHRETPRIPGTWRIVGLTYPAKPEVAWNAGDLLELSFDDVNPHVWIGRPGSKLDDVPTKDLVATYVGPDSFAITFSASGTVHEATAKRLPGEKLLVCTSAEHCLTLERRYNGDHWDLD